MRSRPTLTVLCLFGLVAFGSVPSSFAADQRLIDAAAKEREVVWYTTYIVDQSVRPMIAGFEQRYPGIKVDFVRQGSADLVLRLMNEARAGKVVADIFDGNSTFLPLKKAGFVEQWRPDSAHVFPSQFVDGNGFWTATTVSYNGAMINSEKLPTADWPKGYGDLLATRFSGRMAWSINPDLSAAAGFIGNILMAMGQERGMSYLRQLAAQKITGLQSSSRRVVDEVISGEYSIGLQTLAQQQTVSADKGAPIVWIPLSPVLSALNIVGLIHGSPHPNAAKLFIDYMLSAEGQGIFAKPGYIVPRPGVKLRNPDFSPEVGHFEANILPPEFDTARIARWQKVYDTLFR